MRRINHSRVLALNNLLAASAKSPMDFNAYPTRAARRIFAVLPSISRYRHFSSRYPLEQGRPLLHNIISTASRLSPSDRRV